MTQIESNTMSDTEKRPPAVRRHLPLVVLGALMIVAFALDLHKLVSFDLFIDNYQQITSLVESNLLIAILGFTAIYIVVVALSLPGGLILTVTGGFLFGWIIAAPLTIIAATIGATMIFLIAKTSLGAGLRKRAGPFLNQLQAGFEENAISYLFFLRLVPIIPFWLANLAPAFFGVSTRLYVVTTILGIAPATFAFSFFGSGLGSVIEAQAAARQDCAGTDCASSFDVTSLVTPELLASLSALGLVALIPVAVKKLRK